MGDKFKIFSQKWNYDKMMSWDKPIEHTGTNCGELAISYLGLTSSEICIRDSHYNIKRGNYGRYTTEITKFISDNSSAYRVDTEEYNLNSCDFLENDSRLAKIIGKNRETMVLLKSHKYRLGHYVILSVIDDKAFDKGSGFKIHLIDPSLSQYFSGLDLIKYLIDNHFYTVKDGLNLFFLEIRGKKRNLSANSSISLDTRETTMRRKVKSSKKEVKQTKVKRTTFRMPIKMPIRMPIRTTKVTKVTKNTKTTKKGLEKTKIVNKKKEKGKIQSVINQLSSIRL
jgi:hypothetical protein